MLYILRHCELAKQSSEMQSGLLRHFVPRNDDIRQLGIDTTIDFIFFIYFCLLPEVLFANPR